MYYDITHEGMLEEFKSIYYSLADDIVDSYPSGQMEITIKLADGSKWSYDYTTKGIRHLGNVKRDDSGEYIPEDDYRLEFAIRLRRKLRLRGISYEELCERADISRQTLSKYLNGKSTPTIYTLSKMANVLNCSVSELTDFN